MSDGHHYLKLAVGLARSRAALDQEPHTPQMAMQMDEPANVVHPRSWIVLTVVERLEYFCALAGINPKTVTPELLHQAAASITEAVLGMAGK